MSKKVGIKVLIVRFSSIGDIVLTSPIVRTLKNQFESVEIHYITKSSFKEIISTNPYVDKVFTIDKSIFECINDLKSENYDLVIDLHKNIRTLILKTLLLKPYYSFNKINFAKWLIVNFKINILPKKHIIDRYFEGLSKLKLRNDNQGLDFFIKENTQLPEKFLEFEKSNPSYYSFAIGGTYFTKKCTAEKIVEICSSIDLPVILLGSAAEKKVAKKIKESLAEKCIDLTTETDLQQSALIVKRSKFVISHDTGMMHISAALKKPLISIWGNTIPEFGMYPYFPISETDKYLILEVRKLSCRPCSKLGKHECPKKHFKCTNEIEIKKILTFISNKGIII